MKNPFRAWLMTQHYPVNMASVAGDLNLDPSYVSDLMNEACTMMPSLPVALRIERRTKGKVTPRKMHDFVQRNRIRQDEAA
jgi:DNA-binding transcriptional regulator YdaS (Cro superfamily)